MIGIPCEMPENCEACLCNVHECYCGVTGNFFNFDETTKRADDCPLIELSGRFMTTPCLHFDCDNKNSFGYCKTTCCINLKYNRKKTQETSNCSSRIVTVIEGSLPFTDFVKVVRCKDCKFYTSMRPDIKTGICDLNVHHMGDDGFCSCGERRVE